MLPKISAEKNSHIRAGALAVVALVFFAGWGIHHSMVSATGGIPPCQAVGAATNNMRCFGNTESDLLRAQLLDDCALGDDVIERNWWQDNVHSIEFNYTGQAGLNHGASIDVQTKIVICE